MRGNYFFSEAKIQNTTYPIAQALFKKFVENISPIFPTAHHGHASHALKHMFEINYILFNVPFPGCAFPTMITLSQNTAGNRPDGEITLSCHFEVSVDKVLRFAWWTAEKKSKLYEYNVSYSDF